VNKFIRSIAVLLTSACLMQGAVAQFFFTGPGFLPDENGTNLDDPQAKKVSPNVAAVTIIKDCAECPEMVVIPAGSFVMGSQKNTGEKPQHMVVTRSYLIGKTEVTQEQWQAVMGNNPSFNKGKSLPVEQITWFEIQQFIAKLRQQSAKKYRLPSEAEWQYAARAGTTTEWSHGNDESKLGDYAWYGENSGGKTKPVGQKLPNAFGLYDMHGNVFEWVEDCPAKDYSGAPADGSAWTAHCSVFDSRVYRGGSSSSDAPILRSASRSSFYPQGRNVIIGFRLARDL
jgi:formylglycine-generating enzyme required for sulfatase activity